MSAMSDQPLTVAQFAEYCRTMLVPELRALAQGQERILARLDQLLESLEKRRRS